MKTSRRQAREVALQALYAWQLSGSDPLEQARGLMDVELEYGVPIANGILTTENEKQALARLDKAAEAVRVAAEMHQLRGKFADDKK